MQIVLMGSFAFRSSPFFKRWQHILHSELNNFLLEKKGQIGGKGIRKTRRKKIDW